MRRGVPRSPLNRRGNADTVIVPSVNPGDAERPADQAARHARCVGPVCGIIEITRRGGGMADAAVLKTVGGNPVRVRVPSPAPAVPCDKQPLYLSGYGGCCVGAGAMGLCVPPELLGQASNRPGPGLIQHVGINRRCDGRCAMTQTPIEALAELGDNMLGPFVKTTKSRKEVNVCQAFHLRESRLTIPIPTFRRSNRDQSCDAVPHVRDGSQPAHKYGGQRGARYLSIA